MINRSLDILLIEDDEVDVMQISRAFRKKAISHHLHIARDGMEALELLRGGGERSIPRPQVILLDLNMPRMGGIEFLEHLRKDDRFRNISVFVMTTSEDETDKSSAFRLNVAGYIIKPVSVEKFNLAIDRLNGFWNMIEFPASS